MQQVRGFVYFEGKTFDEVKDAFLEFKLDKVKLMFFKSFSKYGSLISNPGVFITGHVDKKYSTGAIVKIFRKKMNMEEKIIGCDISIESEDVLKSIVDGELKGTCIAIRTAIKKAGNFDKIYDLASQLGSLSKAGNVFVRTVECENDKQWFCIDIITKENFDDLKTKIQNIISSKDLKYTVIFLQS